MGSMHSRCSRMLGDMFWPYRVTAWIRTTTTITTTITSAQMLRESMTLSCRQISSGRGYKSTRSWSYSARRIVSARKHQNAENKETERFILGEASGGRLQERLRNLYPFSCNNAVRLRSDVTLDKFWSATVLSATCLAVRRCCERGKGTTRAAWLFEQLSSQVWPSRNGSLHVDLARQITGRRLSPRILSWSCGSLPRSGHSELPACQLAGLRVKRLFLLSRATAWGICVVRYNKKH